MNNLTNYPPLFSMKYFNILRWEIICNIWYLILRIFYPDQSFYSIKLAHDQILLRGNSTSTVFVNFVKIEISDNGRLNPEDDDPYYLTDISRSKALFLDISRQTLLVKHYWQVLTDICSISKSDLLPLPLPYENHQTIS